MSFVELPREEPLGRYRLSARIAVGGMAELFLGRLIGASGFEKLVAIKRILPHLSADPQFVSMFENEARIAAALHHPNLCEVYELDKADGQLYLAMEFLRGLPWSEIVAAIPDQPQAPFLRFVVGMLVQACEGLQHAHAANVIHRDVSPSNVMITTEGTVKLLDFGVSKITTDRQRTATGMLKGKLPFMSPEQIRTQPLDARVDIWALGVIAWEAIAGRALFDRKSDFEIFKAVLEEDVPALPVAGPVIAELDVVIRRALSRDRDARQSTARTFGEELRRAIASLGEPMSAIEIQERLHAWLGPSLTKRSRELAELLARLRGEPISPSAEVTALAGIVSPSMELTSLHAPAPDAGIRMRDKSIVVGDSLDNLKTNEVKSPSPAAAAPTLEMPSPTAETTAPRDVIGPSPPIMPTAPHQIRIPLDTREPPPIGGLRPWLPVIVLAALAIATGVVVALWP